MPNFNTTDRVEVRAQDQAAPFHAGAVSDDAALGGKAYKINLDTPVTADAWSGVTRRYGGTALVPSVFVLKNAEVLRPGVFIKAEGA